MYRNNNTNDLGFRGRWRWLCAVLLILAVGSTVVAQTDALAPNPDPMASDEVIDANNVVDFSNGCLIKFIAFRKEATIPEGLRLLANLCKKNIVPSAGVQGPLTVPRLYNVTFEQALDAVLGNSFKYEQDGDFVRVYTADELKKIKEDPERMVYKVITLYYITAAEAAKLIEPVLSGSTNAKVQMTTAAQKTISSGSGGSSGGSGGGGLSSTGGGDDMALNDMIVIFDYPENVEKAEALIREVDVRPQQVLVEATIMAVKLTEEMQFGIDWNLLTGVAVTGFPANLTGAARAQAQGTNMETFGFAPSLEAGLSVGVSADNVQALITALEAVTDTTVLANPKVLAVNKQEGQVLIGNKIGYQDTTTTTLTGGTTASVKFLETGTRLVFRPYVCNDGYIRLDIYPKDSDGVLKANGIPDEKTTELKTNVMVKDGQTVVIGGLFRDKIDTSKDQVPVLGNLPILGVLFRRTKDTVSREEVIVMLTPHIITDAAQTDPEGRMNDVRVKREAAKKSLQCGDQARLAEDAYARAAKDYLEGNTAGALFNVRFALMLRPTYLEALRLRERIAAETDPEQFKRMESIAVEKLDEQEAPNWRRY
jgi:type II secretory pathway component GspD/PulD (secretin)